MMAYDGADGYTLAFGGYSNGIIMGDTWTLTGSTWTQVFPATSPPARFDGTLAYDPADGYVVLFGGVPDAACSSALSDTWEYKAGVWTQLTPSSSPAGRYFPSFGWDAKDGYLVMYGGTDCAGTYYGDTWSFVGGQWTQLAPATGPSARFGAGFAYDSAGGQMILFGGYGGGISQSDTWAFSAGSWTQLAPTTVPTARSLQGQMMVTDSGEPFFFGGYDLSTGSCFGDTWKFSGGNWVQLLPATSPASRGWGSMAYDPTQGVVLYGGYDCVADQSDTWLFYNHFQANGTATPDPDDIGGAVVFAGTVSGSVGPFTYSWVYGDGSAASSYLDPTHVYNSTGKFGAHFWANETTGLLRSREGNLSVSVNSLPSVTASATPTSVDALVSIRFTAATSGGAPPFTYAWRFGDGGVGAGMIANHAYPRAGVYTARVWANDSSIGRATNTATVTILAALLHNSNVQPKQLDMGQTTHFFGNVTEGTPPRTTSWTFDDGTAPSSVANTSLTWAAPGTYHVAFWANDSGSSAYVSWYNVTVNPDPVDSFSMAYSPVDAAVQDGFSAITSGGTLPFAYQWRFGDGTSATGVAVTHAWTTPGTYGMALWANDTAGLSAVHHATIVVHPALTVWANISRNPVDLGMATAFTGAWTGGTPPVAFTWNLGDGTWVHSTAFSHTYVVPGSYTVTTWANDTAGGAAVKTATMVVNPAGNVTIALSKPIIDVGAAETFTATPGGGSPPFSYYWDFGDGTSGSGATILHTYVTPGIYFPQLWANDSAGGTAYNVSRVVVNSALQVTVHPLSVWVDQGSPAGFSTLVSGGTSPYNITWNFGDGALGYGLGVSHVYAKSGNYAATLTVTDAGASLVTIPLAVTVNPVLTPTVTLSLSAVDMGATTHISTTVTGGNSTLSYAYLGLPPGCNSADLATLTCTPTGTGEFGISVEVSDGLATSISPAVTLSVTPPVSVARLTFTPSVVTIGVPTTALVTPSGGAAPFNFSYANLPTGCSGSSSVGSFLCTPSATGTFTVTVTVTDASGATAHGSSTLLVNPAPTISSFKANPSSLRVGESTTLTASASGGTGALSYVYTGLPGGCTSQDSFSLSCAPTSSGTFTVTVQVTDSQGVSTTSTLTLTVGGAVSTGTANPLLSGLGIYFLLIAVVLVIVVLLLVVLMRRRGSRAPAARAAAMGSSQDHPEAAEPPVQPEPAPVSPLAPSDPGPGSAAVGSPADASSTETFPGLATSPGATEAPLAPGGAPTPPPSLPATEKSVRTCLICGRPLNALGACPVCGWHAPE